MIHPPGVFGGMISYHFFGVPLFKRIHTPFSTQIKIVVTCKLPYCEGNSPSSFYFFFLPRLFVRLDDVFFGFFVWDVLPRIDALITLYDGNV